MCSWMRGSSLLVSLSLCSRISLHVLECLSMMSPTRSVTFSTGSKLANMAVGGTQRACQCQLSCHCGWLPAWMPCHCVSPLMSTLSCRLWVASSMDIIPTAHIQRLCWEKKGEGIWCLCIFVFYERCFQILLPTLAYIVVPSMDAMSLSFSSRVPYCILQHPA